MNKSDIFLFPSFEGGGMVVLEAMAAGLPVVCLDYGGPGEMVTDDEILPPRRWRNFPAWQANVAIDVAYMLQ